MKRAKGSRRIRVTKPIRATAYAVKVKAFDSLKFLDLRALSKARRAVFEVGTVETRKGTITVVAHVRNGKIVGLAPKGCADCMAKKGKSLAKGDVKGMLLALAKQGLSRLGGPVLPMPIGSSTTALRARLNRIIITDIDIKWFDVCIYYRSDDGSYCVWCLFGPSFCVDAISGAG